MAGRGRSSNMLSDAGSKFGGEEEDILSQYMGQSAYGGASNVGADMGSNFGGNPLATPVLGKQVSSGTNEGPGIGGGGGPRSSGSRRRQVLERNNLNSGG